VADEKTFPLDSIPSSILVFSIHEGTDDLYVRYLKQNGRFDHFIPENA